MYTWAGRGLVVRVVPVARQPCRVVERLDVPDQVAKVHGSEEHQRNAQAREHVLSGRATAGRTGAAGRGIRPLAGAHERALPRRTAQVRTRMLAALESGPLWRHAEKRAQGSGGSDLL